MAESQAIAGFGTKLLRGSGTPLTYAEIGEIGDLPLPPMKRDTIDVSHQSSPGGWKEYIGGMRDAGDLKFTVAYRPELDQQWIDDFNSESKVNYQIKLPDTAETTWTFKGLVVEFQAKAPLNDKLTADVTIKVTGQPVITDNA